MTLVDMSNAECPQCLQKSKIIKTIEIKKTINNLFVEITKWECSLCDLCLATKEIEDAKTTER